MEDTEIIKLFFAREPSAIRETANKYGAYLRKMAGNILRNAEDAEEVVNDTYFRVWNAIPPEQPTVLRHYLSRITRNLAFDRLRHDAAQSREAHTVALAEEFDECLPDSRGSAEDILEARELGAHINRFLARLDKTDRGILISRFYYAEPIRCIAEKFGLTQRQAKYRLSCLRRDLKNYLEREGVLL